MEKAKIMLVDDELSPKKNGPDGSYMWYYTEAMRDSGFEVTQVVGPDSALQKLSSKSSKFDLIIVDIMMPPGEAYENENTLDGLRTGIFLAKTIQEKYPELPILVLTNVLNPYALNKMKEMESVKKVLVKPNCTPFELVEEISEI